MTAEGLQGGANTANLVGGLASSVAAFQSTRKARKSMNAQADFIERTAEQEAEAIIQAGDARLMAFSARASELAEEEGINRFSGAARAREARESGRSMVSRIQARSAASGIVVSVGSPLELAAQAAFESEKQAANEELQTRLISENLLSRARQELKAGQAARFAAQLQARSTILTAKAQSVGIRSQAPSTMDVIGSLTRPLTALTPDQLESGLTVFTRNRKDNLKPILVD
jgi:hypothetical protein